MPSSSLQYDVFRAAAPLAIGVLAILLASSLREGFKARNALGLFSAFVAATIGYLGANFLELSSSTEAGVRLWSRLLYLFISPMPVIWLDFCLRFSREGRGLSRAGLAAALAVPVATLAVIFAPALSGLMWSGVQYLRRDRYVFGVYEHGPWFAVYAAYTYGLFIAGAVLLLRAFAHRRRFYGRQAAWVIVGICIPLGTSLVYVLRPFPGLVKDFTPLGYAAGEILFYVALFHRDLFSIAPVGRSLVVERLDTGVLVIDSEGRLADANPSAMRVLGLGEGHLGRPLSAPSCSSIREALEKGRPREALIEVEGRRRSFRIEASPLPSGRVVTMSDQTELRDLLSRLQELALCDELTGLPNRRGFMSDAGRSLARARRQGLAFAVAMIDFDGFKSINDERGHAAGDAVLRAFGQILATEPRAGDLPGRLGGDEFAVAVIGDGAGLRVLCERLRRRLAEADIRDEAGDRVAATISAGIAESASPCRDGLERLLAEADTALYEAKHRGRDAIVLRVAG